MTSSGTTRSCKIASIVAILGNILIIAGGATPFWWKVSLSLSGIGTFQVYLGLFQTCYVWFCEMEGIGSDLACDISDTLLLGDSESGSLQCEGFDASDDINEDKWLTFRAMIIVGSLLAFAAIILLIASCCRKVGQSVKKTGAVMSFFAGIFGIVTVFLFFDLTKKNDMESSASSLTLDNRDWISGSSAFSYSFMIEIAGAFLAVVASSVLF